MSTAVFDGTSHTLTLKDAQGHQVGQWHANNVVDRHATFRYVPNADYRIIDNNRPLRHGATADSPNGAYGSYGIVRLQQFNANGHLHEGVGIHSGRANRGAADHATMGCIRTTDAAMQTITNHILADPLQSITVQNNHDQANIRPHHAGDPHPHHRPLPAARRPAFQAPEVPPAFRRP